MESWEGIKFIKQGKRNFLNKKALRVSILPIKKVV